MARTKCLSEIKCKTYLLIQEVTTKVRLKLLPEISTTLLEEQLLEILPDDSHLIQPETRLLERMIQVLLGVRISKVL
jgi:hypothetical protein